MKTHYQAIYLAPHLDDVALSCGGQIKQRTAAGQQILIVSIMAGDPPTPAVSNYVQELHTRWELATASAVDATAARRAEDLVACRILGADALHWPIPDCIYRTDPASGEPFYVSDLDIFGEVQPADRHWVGKLADWIRALPPHDELFVPLTIGHHVDHQLTRLAAEHTGSNHLLYYEDYPYAQQAGALDTFLANENSMWQTSSIPLSEAALTSKIEAILAFRSQFSTFWTDRADLERQIFDYARSVGGERIWQHATS